MTASCSNHLVLVKQFVRFRSVSADSTNGEALRECSGWLRDHLHRIGLGTARVLSTAGHPVVFGEYQTLRRRPTVLVYGHYDVQPADPLHEWRSPPFEPVIRGDYLYGRGACDDKGQLFCHVKAIESYLKTHGELPVNVKLLIEGEEEIGSPNLHAFVERHLDELAADVAVISDSPMRGPKQPALTYALRGALSLDLEVHGLDRDLHSGQFGGAVHNPAQALAEILSRLHDRNGRIAIPGFYDRVRSVAPAERAYLARTGPRDAEILHNAGTAAGWGEAGYSLYERTTIRPALTINGITAGYQGPGVKAVIPRSASAKLNFRLVPDQDPREIDLLFRKFLDKVTPLTVRIAVRTQIAAKPVLIDHRHSAMRAAARAYERTFGVPPVLIRSGGTIPVVNMFQELLGIPTVLMGFGLPDAGIHGPNERLHLPTFFKGIQTSIHFLAEAGRSLKPRAISCGQGRGIAA